MSFRILYDKKLVQSSSRVDSLKTVYISDELKIDVVSNSITGRTPQGGHYACVGNIVGKRNQSGSLSRLDGIREFIESEIDSSTLHDLTEQLEGFFLIISVDKDGVCTVRSDRFAKVEVYIQRPNEGVALASNLSLLPEDPSLGGFDQAALAHMMTYYGYCPPKQHTIYKSVRRLGVGDTAIIKEGDISIDHSPFSPVEAGKYGEQEHQEYADLFLSHLKTAGSSKGNVVFLSSGWDSTAILAGLVHLFGADKVRAVTGRMRYSERSGVCNQIEIDRAQKMADYYGVKLSFVEFDYVDKAPEFFDANRQLMRSHQLYGLTGLSHGRLAEFTKQSSECDEAVFAGEISDGAHNLGFSQYATIFHPSYGFREYSDKMASYLFGPTFLLLLQQGEHEKDPIFNLMTTRAPGVKYDPIVSDPDQRTMQLLTSFFLRNGRIPLWSLANSRLLTQEGGSFYTEEMQKTYLTEAAAQATPGTIYSWYLHLYNSFHWQGGTVRSMSVMADNLRLNLDIPYWDGGIQDFLSAMPEDWGRGLDLNPTKFPLKWMLKNRIDYPYELQTGPHSYTYDVDHSFNHSEEVFCHSKMMPVFQRALASKPYRQILSSDIFNLTYIDDLVDDYVSGKPISVAALTDIIPVILLSYIGWYGQQR
ncbi:protein of unknown function [uncultured Woeseiaceae bacterium]|uniref:Asparagine synthetase domain-containing protein n=1 Tax=uncultured Woeseiaceae bacterium TaxID=1983305 RepID=A0A7D9D144_9GAMM|nr:protein of unknown function [uncultured Woeseiaceae bacterium]